MDRTTAILGTLAAYQIALLAMGILARRRTRDAAGFYLGGRTLGPWVAALAANASSSSAWSLLGVSGFAYANGLAALWLLPGCLFGFALNYFLVAPRVRNDPALTLTELLAGPGSSRARTAFVAFASVLTLASLLAYVSSQMRGAGDTFLFVFDLPTERRWLGILVGAAVVVAYVFLGGYLAASITDTLQAVLMVLVAFVLPIAGVVSAGGPAALLRALEASPGAMDLFAGRSGGPAAGFALGLLGIGLGYPGQPHAVNKYMGMRADASMAVARAVGLSWAAILYSGMILAGLAARVLVSMPAGQHENAIYALAEATLPELASGLVVAAVLAAMMSTVDAMLLVCASSVTHDLGRRGEGPAMLRRARLTVLAISAGAVGAAMVVEQSIFRYVMFAWSVLGSAFGPPLVARILLGPVPAPWLLASSVSGAAIALAGSFATLLASGFDERVLAWFVAFSIAGAGSLRSAAARSAKR
ncbi:MAG: sodium/proline symporter PutP [Planctomycetota bacterium]